VLRRISAIGGGNRLALLPRDPLEHLPHDRYHFLEPMQRLHATLAQRGVPWDRFQTLRPGEALAWRI